MSLLTIMQDFTEKDDSAEKAAFEKAMTERINKDGYKMADLMFEVYKCQRDLALVVVAVESIIEDCSDKPTTVSRKKPAKKAE